MDIEKMEQANGQDDKDIKRLQKLEKLMGLRVKNPFGVNTLEELEAKLGEMTLLDMQRMAVSSGIPGGGDRRVLKNKLVKEFEKFTRGGHGSSFSSTSDYQFKGRGAKKREEMAKKLLAE